MNMLKRIGLVSVAAVVVALGCSKAAEEVPQPMPVAKDAVATEKPASAPQEGANDPAPAPVPGDPMATTEHAEEHAHVHAAPHGGTLIEVGDHAGNVELVHDGESGTLTAYMLDGEAENPVRLSSTGIPVQLNVEGKEPVNVLLKPVENVLTGETATATSQYEIQHDVLKGVTTFSGQFTELYFQGMEIEGMPFSVSSQ